jgi:hypothetical protein
MKGLLRRNNNFIMCTLVSIANWSITYIGGSKVQLKFNLLLALDSPLLPDEILRNQFQKLTIEPLMHVEKSYTSPLVIVIDALDECADETLVGEIISLTWPFRQNTKTWGS